MSEYERNKGKLIPVDVDTEYFTEDDYETYQENGFVVFDKEIYEVEWTIQRDTECYDFADIIKNVDGTINFHTYHYNGGAHWTELIEDALKNK